MDILSEGLSQLGLLRENKYSAIPSRLTILKKGILDGEVGSLDVEQDGLDSQLHSPRALRLSNIVILLADNSFTNQPSLETVHSMFEELEIPFKEYLEMIASFFPVKPPYEKPMRLRPAPYPESPVDIRFTSRSQLQPLGNEPEELCYNIYIVDNPPSIRSTPESFSITNLTKNLPIHKCAIFIDPSHDRVVLTSTYQGLRNSLMQIKYHDHEVYSIPPLIYAFQYVITEIATTGWDRCLDTLETALEDVLHRLFAPRRDSKNTDQEVNLLNQHWENLNALQHCCNDLQGLIRANQRVLSAIGDTEAYSPFAQFGKQFLTRLEWHMDRAVDLKTAIKTALCRYRAAIKKRMGIEELTEDSLHI
ncbi:hypothetical protein FPANT_826 [Fusarium pseudoanthophilum]|uniref:Uncharacterized protein n=1 Tax=Fusarium pseudoanthophilum TaxID=48495 RepID=A0A8H5Q3P8_9HYPO|nr:hypothetical protein FPANT_826 [Fusarium pseudoanthophilum]